MPICQPATLRCCFLRSKVGLKLENYELNHRLPYFSVFSCIFPYVPQFFSVVLSICFRPIVICCVQSQQLAEVFELFGRFADFIPETTRTLDIRSPPLDCNSRGGLYQSRWTVTVAVDCNSPCCHLYCPIPLFLSCSFSGQAAAVALVGTAVYTRNPCTECLVGTTFPLGSERTMPPICSWKLRRFCKRLKTWWCQSYSW